MVKKEIKKTRKCGQSSYLGFMGNKPPIFCSNVARPFASAPVPKYPLACGNSSCVVNATTCPYMQLAATQCINGNVNQTPLLPSSPGLWAEGD